VTGRKPDVVITDDVAGARPARRVMVTGSRTFGLCEHKPTHRYPTECPSTLIQQHRALMIRAFHEHGLMDGWLNGERYELIHGDARGADRLAADMWGHWHLGPITAFPYVKELGRAGGHARNGVLVAHMPDVVLAFHLDNSPGTADAIRQAKAAGLDVHVYPKGES
jgi:hypothetical protein